MDGLRTTPLAVKTFSLQGHRSMRIDVGGNREISNCLQGKALGAIIWL